MAQTVPIDAYLGAHRTGLIIGATLYQLDGTTVHAAFSTSGWYEAPAASGAWHHPGVSLPDAGGVVAVGISGTEYMRVAVEAAKPLASDYTAARAAKLDNLDVAVSTRATPAQVNTEADTALADVGLTSTVTGRIDATISSRATPANITTAQAAIEAAIAALNDLSTADIDARLTAYDGATQADLTATQTAITNAISALNNLSQAQAQTAATAALNAYDPPTKAELDTAQTAIIDAVPTTAEIDTQLSGTHGAGSWVDTGSGATAAQVWSYATRTLTALGSPAGIEFTYTVTNTTTTLPIADVSVWFGTDSAVSNVVWYGSTDAFGIARDANGNKPRLDSGVYFILCRKVGFSFTVDSETVSA